MNSKARLHFAIAPICPDVSLNALGISTEEPHGRIIYRIISGKLVAEIGKLVVIADTIHAIPKHDITERQRNYLLGAAEAAFFTPRAKALGWRHDIIDDIERWTRWIATPAENINLVAWEGAIQAQPQTALPTP